MTDGESFDDVFGDLDEVELHEAATFPIDDSPLPFDLAGPDLERWAPPSLPFDVEMDHLIGGEVLEILPTNSQDGEARDLEREIRRLPRQLGSIARALNDVSHRAALVGAIDGEVCKAAAPTALRYVEVPGVIYKASYVLEIHRRAALTKLAMDAAFVDKLKCRVDQIKRQGHLVNTYGGSPVSIPELPSCAVPSVGPWNAESWLGLSTSSLPEAMPEEIAVAIAQRTWRRFSHHGGRARRPRLARVLHWGALNGTLAFALQSTAPRGRTLVIHEVDSVGQPQSREWKGQRFRGLPVHGEYDLVVVHVPPPGEGANHIRNRYKDLAGPPDGDVHLEDLGRRGPRKWRRSVLKLIKEVTPRLKANGELVLLLPTAVRTAPAINGYPQWGYEQRADLLTGIVELLVEAQLSVVADVDVVERNPINQPYFVDRRCPWRFVIASLDSSTHRREDDSVDSLLAGLEVDLG